jgi:hypothetical protein
LGAARGQRPRKGSCASYPNPPDFAFFSRERRADGPAFAFQFHYPSNHRLLPCIAVYRRRVVNSRSASYEWVGEEDRFVC